MIIFPAKYLRPLNTECHFRGRASANTSIFRNNTRGKGRKRSLCISRREASGNGILRIPFGISTYDFPLLRLKLQTISGISLRVAAPRDSPSCERSIGKLLPFPKYSNLDIFLNAFTRWKSGRIKSEGRRYVRGGGFSTTRS